VAAINSKEGGKAEGKAGGMVKRVDLAGMDGWISSPFSTQRWRSARCFLQSAGVQFRLTFISRKHK
jgi:hypothetical protein